MNARDLFTRIASRLRVKGGSSGSGGAIGNATMEGCIPISWPSNWWQQGRAPGYGAEPAIRQACIDAYAQTIASMDLSLLKKTARGGFDEVEGGAVPDLLRNPNSYQTRSDFVLNLIWQLFEFGNAYAVFEREGRDVVAMHIVGARNTTPYVDSETKAIYYGIGGNPLVPDGVDYLVPQRDVLHVRLHCPRHPLIGVSPLAAAAMAMAANSAITAHQSAFFSHMARPSGVLSTDATLSRVQIDMLRKAWEDQSIGLNAGGVPILSNGMKWQSLAMTSEDSQIAAAFNMTVEDVARAFRVPLPLVGSPVGATYSNVEQLIALWMGTGLGFVLEHVESAMDMALDIPHGQAIQFDTDALQRTDFKGRVEALTKGISGGLYAPNEARAREGLPRVAFGDEPRLQAQVVPLSQVGMTPATPAPSAAPAPSTDDDATTEPAAPAEPAANDDDAKDAEANPRAYLLGRIRRHG